MAIEKDDFRPSSHETDGDRMLRGRVWRWKAYQRYSATWEHDHCEFCWEKLAEAGQPDSVHEAYSTQDDFYWVCRACFEDFREAYAWTIDPASTPAPDL